MLIVIADLKNIFEIKLPLNNVPKWKYFFWHLFGENKCKWVFIKSKCY